MKSFHLNGHTLGFRPLVQNYKLIPPLECTHQEFSFEWSHFGFSPIPIIAPNYKLNSHLLN